jgi:hypothetical protein
MSMFGEPLLQTAAASLPAGIVSGPDGIDTYDAGVADLQFTPYKQQHGVSFYFDRARQVIVYNPAWSPLNSGPCCCAGGNGFVCCPELTPRKKDAIDIPFSTVKNVYVQSFKIELRSVRRGGPTVKECLLLRCDLNNAHKELDLMEFATSSFAGATQEFRPHLEAWTAYLESLPGVQFNPAALGIAPAMSRPPAQLERLAGSMDERRDGAKLSAVGPKMFADKYTAPHQPPAMQTMGGDIL